MLKPNIKYKVALTGEECEALKKLVKKGRTADHRIRHAQILLALDEIPENEHWTDEDRRGVRLPGAGRWQTAQALRRAGLRRGAGAEEAGDPAMEGG